MLGRVLAAFGLIVAVSAAAQAQNTTIQGWVIVPTQKHADNFEVQISVRDGFTTFATTRVGDSGRYMFVNQDLRVGNFDILILLDGFRESRTPLRRPPETGTLAEIPIFENIILIPDAEGGHLTDIESEYKEALLKEYSKGLDQITAKRPELAVTHLEKIVKEIPDFYDAHINLGLVYQDLKRRREAEAEFRKANELNPESARPLAALGRLFVDEVESELSAGVKRETLQPLLTKGREVLTEAIMLDEKFAKAHYYLGVIEFRSRSYAIAEKELKLALELDRTLFESRIALINLFVQQKLWQAALDNVDTFMLDYPLSPYRNEVAANRMKIVGILQSPR
jgi:tetratricopeptide (TPR) repeat protein